MDYVILLLWHYTVTFTSNDKYLSLNYFYPKNSFFLNFANNNVKPQIYKKEGSSVIFLELNSVAIY